MAPPTKDLVRLKELVSRLETEIANELAQELATLPGRYGFDTADAFIAAVAVATAARLRRRGRPSRARTERGDGARRHRKRAVVTDSTRTEVKKLVREGRTGAEIAKTVGISIGTLHTIKKALGLVKQRK